MGIIPIPIPIPNTQFLGISIPIPESPYLVPPFCYFYKANILSIGKQLTKSKMENGIGIGKFKITLIRAIKFLETKLFAFEKSHMEGTKYGTLRYSYTKLMPKFVCVLSMSIGYGY